MKKLMSIFVILLVVTQVSWGKNYFVATKEKKAGKQYAVEATDKLLIDNKYGAVHINTWNKNEITVDVTITVKANSDAEAQKILDRISLSETQGSHAVTWKTELGSSGVNSDKMEITVDYMVNTPAKCLLDIINKFGNVYVGRFEGIMRMDVAYGALHTEQISGTDNIIKVAFGSADIAFIEGGKLDIAYSNLSIDKAQNIVVINKFGNTSITAVQILQLKQQYGNFEAETVDKIEGDANYAGFEIGKLTKSAEVELKYCSKADFRSVAASVEHMKVWSSYGSVYYHFEEGVSFDVEMSLGYSNIKNQIPNLMQVNLTDGTSSNSTYKGKIGKGGHPFFLNLRYGNVNFK